MSQPFIDIPQREEVSPSITTSPAVSRGSGTFRGVAPDADDTGHDVLGHAPSHVAVHGHSGLLVHAGHEIAGIAADVHLDWIVQSDRDIVHSVGIEYLNYAHVLAGEPMMQVVIQLADTQLRQIEPHGLHAATCQT